MNNTFDIYNCIKALSKNNNFCSPIKCHLSELMLLFISIIIGVYHSCQLKVNALNIFLYGILRYPPNFTIKFNQSAFSKFNRPRLRQNHRKTSDCALALILCTFEKCYTLILITYSACVGAVWCIWPMDKDGPSLDSSPGRTRFRPNRLLTSCMS